MQVWPESDFPVQEENKHFLGIYYMKECNLLKIDNELVQIKIAARAVRSCMN